MTERLENQVAKLLEDLIPPANVVDFGDVAKRVLDLIATRASHDPDNAVTGDVLASLNRALTHSNELYRMVKFLFDHQDECIGDHPDWLRGVDKLLDGEHFDALSELAHDGVSP